MVVAYLGVVSEEIFDEILWKKWAFGYVDSSFYCKVGLHFLKTFCLSYRRRKKFPED
jgi:hypothetical protein